MNHHQHMLHVAKALTPPDVWDWLMIQLDLQHSKREIVYLWPDCDLAIEYHEKMRNY